MLVRAYVWQHARVKTAGRFNFEEFLDVWVDALLRIVNQTDEMGEILLAHEPGDARSRLQNALQRIVDGKPGIIAAKTLENLVDDKTVRWLPRVGVRIDERGRAIPVFQKSDAYVILDEETLHTVIIVLAADPRARRLRRCDWQKCRAFFFTKANHRRAHSFCSEQHRRAYDVARRDPEQIAKYMKKYRSTVKRLKMAKTTRRGR